MVMTYSNSLPIYPSVLFSIDADVNQTTSNQNGNPTNDTHTQPNGMEQSDQHKPKKTNSVDIKRDEILETDALKDISQIKEEDKKFDERLLESPDHSNIHDASTYN